MVQLAEKTPAKQVLGKIASVQIAFYDSNYSNDVRVHYVFSSPGLRIDWTEGLDTLAGVMFKAQAMTLYNLQNKPIRMWLSGGVLERWEILEECI